MTFTDSEQKLAAFIDVGIEIRKSSLLGHEINYAMCGSGEPLLLIHGGTLGWGMWFANMKELSKHFTVYAIDLPGAGRSSPIDYRTISLQRDFVDVVEAFIKEKNLVPMIIGNSFGGWVAFEVAKRTKVKKLVLVDSVGFSTAASLPDLVVSQYPIARFVSKMVLKPEPRNARIEAFLRSVFYNKRISIPREFIDYFYDTMHLHHNLLFISRLINLRKQTYFPEEKPNAPCPTLIIWGENDPVLPFRKSEQAAKAMRNAELKIFPKTGHLPQMEHPGEFNELVLKFLTR